MGVSGNDVVVAMMVVAIVSDCSGYISGSEIKIVIAVEVAVVKYGTTVILVGMAVVEILVWNKVTVTLTSVTVRDMILDI